ncbi:Reverse transcriptase domain protein [Luminiphilus syltensis NOR5-1B]|uniref:Reverse transcriptase domain protein n=1 Tax=Luminiphilus syltensis NOR5-1B TaxID=565045 RepID=B8KSI5_9GAMM|nr:reverse transcriptase/maturase family protein [Luminiphilus syltensis]EED34442.1 Reverse transcriptase domain protein [Luminiphilus syltensis NOR5-1B]
MEAQHIDTAYLWLCHRRQHYPDNADIWHLRFHWQSERERILDALRQSSYRVSPLQCIHRADGTVIHLWSAADALVAKALALAIRPHLGISKRCTHIKGNGGLKGAVRAVERNSTWFRFVIRTDVKAYYESIDQSLLLTQLSAHINDRWTLNLLSQFIGRTVEHGGLYRDIRRGIGRGSPLSPLFGAVYLQELDAALEPRDVFYVRYMDDILVMARTRWQLRRAIAVLNGVLGRLKLSKHPDKTSIGYIARGFDFLGYRFSRNRLQLARKTLDNMRSTLSRLYEQKKADPQRSAYLGAYLRRWRGWARGGLCEISVDLAVRARSCEPKKGLLWNNRRSIA